MSEASFEVPKVINGKIANEVIPNGISADKIVDGTTNKAFTSAEKTKLAGLSNSSGGSGGTFDGTNPVKITAPSGEDTPALYVNSKNSSNKASSAVVGEDVKTGTGPNRAKLTIGNSAGNSELIVGQSEDHALLFNWEYNSNADSAISNLETWGGKNLINIQNNGGSVKLGGTDGKVGFFGSTPVAKPGVPTTLADVISVLQTLGLVSGTPSGNTGGGTGGTGTSPTPSTGSTKSALTRKGSIVSMGSTGAFDAGFIESPNVIWDPTQNRWVMVYTAYNDNKQTASVGAATAVSLDGPWTKQGKIFGGSGSGGDANGTTGPVLYYDNGTFYLYYIGLANAGYEAGVSGIFLATSNSALGPWTRQGVKIEASPSASWRSNTVWHINIVKKNSTYYAFFNAGNGSTEKIGYATSSSPAGPWTVDDVNSPILSPGTGSDWDAGLIGDPYVYKLGSTWFMAYYGVNSSFGNQSDGEAYTSEANFPLGWVKNPNRILTPGAQYTYDGKSASKPSIIINGNTYYHFYSAQSSEGVPSIGYATATIS